MTAARGHYVPKQFWTLEVEEECKEAEGNPNHINTVAVKTDVEIIVGNLFRQPVLCFCVGEVRLCVRSQAAGKCQQIYQNEA